MIVQDFLRELGTPNIIKYKNGDLYTGQVSNDRKNGKGCMHYNNEDIFVGLWKDDQPEGFGIFISRNKTRFEGLF